MAGRRIGCALAMLALAGCDDRPGDYPALLPTEQILADPALPAHAAEAATDPDAVASGLQNRASALAARVPGSPPIDSDLNARAKALQARAAEQARPLPARSTAAPAAASDLDARIRALRTRAAELTRPLPAKPAATPPDPCPNGAETCAQPDQKE